MQFRDHEVRRHALPQRLADHPFQFVDAVVWGQHRGHAAGRRGDRLEPVIDRVAEIVMRHETQVLDAFAGHANEMEDRQAMRLAAHHAIDRRQLANSVGGREKRCPADAGVAVGGVRGVELVRARHPLESGHLLDGVVDRERVVPWHPEDPVDAELGEASEGVLSYGWIGHGEKDRSANSTSASVGRAGLIGRGRGRKSARS